MKTIQLTQNQVAYVDDDKYEMLSKFKWHARKAKKKFHAITRIGDEFVRMHRLLLGLSVLESKMQADHIDGNSLNNTMSNLRVVTNSQNQMNAFSSGGKSKYKGVAWHKHKKRWYANIRINNKQTGLGYYRHEVDAAKAYNKACVKHFGCFARPNIISEDSNVS